MATASLRRFTRNPAAPPRSPQFAYDDAQDSVPNIWADLDANGSLTTRRIFGDGLRPASRPHRQQRSRLVFDRSPRLYHGDIATNGGLLIDHIDYDAFGNILSETSPLAETATSSRGCSLITDGSLYTRGRDDDTETGRWDQQDPIGVTGTNPNLYPYVANDPLNALDQTGEVALFFDGAHQTEKSRSNIYRLYEASKDPHRDYIKSPVAWGTNWADLLKLKNPLKEFQRQAASAANEAIKVCEKAAKEQKEEPIDIFGWSRGAALAVATIDTFAGYIKKESLPFRIRFVGLIDPVATGIIGAPSTIPAIVKVLWLGVRDKTVDKKDPKAALFPILQSDDSRQECDKVDKQVLCPYSWGYRV